MRDFNRHRLVAGLLLALVATLASAALLASAAAAGGSAYTIINLGTLGGGNSYATSINDAGQVVGYSYTAASYRHAFLWTEEGGMVDLGALSTYGESFAEAVNASGQVVGGAYNPSHAFSWTEEHGMVDLGTLEGTGLYKYSSATGVNDNGQVIGRSTVAGTWQAFSWTKEGGMIDLGTLGGSSSTVWALNNSGQAVGGSFTGDGVGHAFLWTEGSGMVDLDTPDSWGSVAYDINGPGQVVGQRGLHAFSWTPAGGMVDLGTLGGSSSRAMRVNEGGQVMGVSKTASGDEHAFIWTEEGGMVDLGGLGSRYSYSQPSALNDNGEVVGYSRGDDGWYHGFVWSEGDGMVDLGALPGVMTSTQASAINNHGDIVGYSGYHAVLWTSSMDTTPPEITVPGDLTVNATSPDGAVVEFTATATDDVDGSVSVDCTPASGSTFAIGDTTVVCTAEDNSGNEATESFTIHVAGAMEQLDYLFAAVEGIGPGTSLADMVSEVQAALGGGDNAEACEILNAFVNHLEAQAGKHVDALVADALIADATRLRAVLGCST